MNTPSRKDFSNVSVLVVEDNMVNLLLVKNLLKKFGFAQVDSAENGKEAIRKMEGRAYDLVLMDIQMPGMDGYDVTRQLRASANANWNTVPVIALSGDASEKEKEKAKTAGMNDYLAKPYAPEELYHMLTKFVRPAVPLPAFAAAGMDLAVLEKFTGGDHDLTIQLIEIFLVQVPEAVETIDRLIPEKRWAEIFPVAHKVKSSFAIFGLEEMRDCILTIEEYTRDTVHLEKLPALFTKFKAGSEVAVENLRIELRKLKSLHT